MKLDLIAHAKGNAQLMQKIESAFASHNKANNQGEPATTKASDTSSNSNANSRATTPPMQSLAKVNMKIRMGRGEIEQTKGQAPEIVSFAGSDPRDKNGKNVESLHQLFLNYLLRPKEWSSNVDGQTYFAFRREHVIALAEEAQKVVEQQPMVLRVDAPVKVFGDIHGQYQDLMRFFDLWGTPDENGDIES